MRNLLYFCVALYMHLQLRPMCLTEHIVSTLCCACTQGTHLSHNTAPAHIVHSHHHISIPAHRAYKTHSAHRAHRAHRAQRAHRAHIHHLISVPAHRAHRKHRAHRAHSTVFTERCRPWTVPGHYRASDLVRAPTSARLTSTPPFIICFRHFFVRGILELWFFSQ